MSVPFVDRAAVVRRFSRVAPTYAGADFFAREIDRRMFERLDYVRIAPRRIVDLGCSLGGSFAGLAALYPDAELIGIDAAPAMLHAGQVPRAGWQP